ncbi:Uncharacterized protein HDU86_000323 [Geranomyces michiganensis]|nr:Uncharacterized protein HDU86_000323 [Geranomyces michiganensis]
MEGRIMAQLPPAANRQTLLADIAGLRPIPAFRAQRRARSQCPESSSRRRRVEDFGDAPDRALDKDPLSCTALQQTVRRIQHEDAPARAAEFPALRPQSDRERMLSLSLGIKQVGTRPLNRDVILSSDPDRQIALNRRVDNIYNVPEIKRQYSIDGGNPMPPAELEKVIYLRTIDLDKLHPALIHAKNTDAVEIRREKDDALSLHDKSLIVTIRADANVGLEIDESASLVPRRLAFLIVSAQGGIVNLGSDAVEDNTTAAHQRHFTIPPRAVALGYLPNPSALACRACVVRLLQEEAPDRKVLLVDRSDEIGGASDIPHRCLGSNVQVLRLRGQPCADVIARAFRNHSADVVVVDEIGGADEASMVLDLKSRGVTVITTCHGGLAEVLKSNALGRLLGEITSSVGDE